MTITTSDATSYVNNENLTELLSKKNQNIEDLNRDNDLMKNLLNEAVNNSDKLFHENEALEEELRKTKKELLQSKEKIDELLGESSVNLSKRSNKVLFLELNEALVTFDRTKKTLLDFSAISSCDSPDKRNIDSIYSPIIDSIEESMESIERTIQEVSR